jgi:hypothetical protein
LEDGDAISLLTNAGIDTKSGTWHCKDEAARCYYILCYIKCVFRSLEKQ